MGKKTYWFKAGRTFTLRGTGEGGLVPFGWKGWLFTVICAALALGAWRLALFAGAHHWTRIAFGSWIALAVDALVYVLVACFKSR